MLLSFHVQLLTHIIHVRKLHTFYRLFSLFAMRSVPFEYLNKVGVWAVMDPKLQEQRSIIKCLLLEGEKS